MPRSPGSRACRRGRCGPPPTASEMTLQSGWRIGREVTSSRQRPRLGASRRLCPRAMSTAVPGVRGIEAFCAVATTGAVRSALAPSRERCENDRERTSNTRCRASPVGGEKGDPVVPRRVVEVSASAPLSRAAPRSEELDRTNLKVPSRLIPALERCPFGGVTSTPSRSKIPLGLPSAILREVAVHPDHRRLARETPLHRRERLLAEHGLIRQHRPKPI